MEPLKDQKNAMLELLFQEPSVALLSVPTFFLELLVAMLQASAQRDQNVESLWAVVHWFAYQENLGKSEPDAEEEDSSHERPARLMELAVNNSSSRMRNSTKMTNQ
jgi:hypothetical protein